MRATSLDFSRAKKRQNGNKTRTHNRYAIRLLHTIVTAKIDYNELKGIEKKRFEMKTKKVPPISFINSISVRFSVSLSDLNSAQSEKEMETKERVIQ